MKRILSALSAVFMMSAGGLALAQQGGAHHNHGSSRSSSDSPAVAAYKAANDKMHKDMDIAFTGDADTDFIRGMIPHHQGAIDMARVVLAYGKDAQTKKLAEDIIKAQESEIAMMKEWLKKRGQ